MIAKYSVALCLAVALGASGGRAEEVSVDELFERLRDADAQSWKPVEEEIWRAWSVSGSPTADLLLQRGREAMEAGENEVAIEHLTALTDHAPDFAEGWNARATAYFQAGIYGPALADIERTLALNPRHFAALAGLGRILEEIGRDRDALSAYRASLTLHPHRPNVREAVERLELATGGSTL